MNLFCRCLSQPAKRPSRNCRHRHSTHHNRKTSKENSHNIQETESLDTSFNKISELSVQDYKALSECLRIGMSTANCYNNGPAEETPKVLTENEESVKNIGGGKDRSFLVGYGSAKDELASYQVENSPYHFSLRSSLSDLTVDGSVAGIKR